MGEPKERSTLGSSSSAALSSDGLLCWILSAVVHSGVDKFLGTKLEAALKAKHIRTVIVTGTVAHGAVLYTASAASLRGFKVAVPVDTLSAPDPFAELPAVWILSNAPASVAKNMNVTRSDMVQF